MPSEFLLILMSVGAVLFTGLIVYIYRVWGREGKDAELQRMAFQKVQEDLSNSQKGLENEKVVRAQVEKRLNEAKQQLETTGQDRTSDRTAYQGLFDKLEGQMKEKEAELREKEKKIAELEASMHPPQPQEVKPSDPQEEQPAPETPPEPNPPQQPDRTEDPPKEQHG